jgi:hypothetical protein
VLLPSHQDNVLPPPQANDDGAGANNRVAVHGGVHQRRAAQHARCRHATPIADTAATTDIIPSTTIRLPPPPSPALAQQHLQLQTPNAHAHTHTHTHTHAHAHARMHARTHARTHTRTHAPTHPRTHAPTLAHERTHRMNRPMSSQSSFSPDRQDLPPTKRRA